MASSTPTTGFEHFGLKLYSTVSEGQKDQNIFLSPASIALAMSMCTVGARKETLNQMLKALEASTTAQLTSTAEQVMRVFSIADQDKQVQLKLANRLYAQKAYKLQEDYLKQVQSSFAADIKLEDFENESAKVVQTINAWVEEQTNKLIKNLLSPNDVTSDTRLIIINCIYFKGTWVKQFDENATNEQADFHEANGKTSKVKLMYKKDKYAYAENKDLGVQIAHLPYKSDNRDVQFVFTVILPKQGVSLSDVEKKLTSKPDLMQEVLNHQGTTTQELLLYLPKFKMEATFTLNDVLKQLGIQDAFDPNAADFTGIVSKQDDMAGLYISKVIHKAFIDVNEKGSEAAAATAVIMLRSCCVRRQDPDPIEFKADHPFLFMIRECSEAAAATAVVMTLSCAIVRNRDPIEFKADHPFLFMIRECSEAAAATAVIMMRECCMVRQDPDPIMFKADHPFLFMIRECRSEAAAATAVIMLRASRAVHRNPDPIEFKVDHPFLFMIRECHQNITLFTGKYLSPPTS
ncbi:unnamed protein product [Adineta steineri]|uniref:Serpin domain-containing protein n=2 Tax=Adineta steineri TaxID=433720 RepID=A0A814A9H1_9BILA|nr:unnamed protein product [Adineta steineri]